MKRQDTIILAQKHIVVEHNVDICAGEIQARHYTDRMFKIDYLKICFVCTRCGPCCIPEQP